MLKQSSHTKKKASRAAATAKPTKPADKKETLEIIEAIDNFVIHLLEKKKEFLLRTTPVRKDFDERAFNDMIIRMMKIWAGSRTRKGVTHA